MGVPISGQMFLIPASMKPGEITRIVNQGYDPGLLSDGFHRLLDELNILLHPIAVGRGQRLFEDTPTTPLELRSSATLPTGVLHLRYTPTADA